MPTYERANRFLKDWNKLSAEEQQAFRAAVAEFIDDLTSGRGFRNGLRVKRIQGTSDHWEMTWADKGRAVWRYGKPVRDGMAHVVWVRIGGHTILGDPTE